MKLYAVTISGHKYYYTGDLSASDIKMIDEYCDTLNCPADSKDVLSSLQYDIPPANIHFLRVLQHDIAHQTR